MPRTSVTLTESALNLADSRAKEKGLTRSDYIAAAVESALNQTESDLNQLAEKDKIIESIKLELNQLESELNQAQLDLAKLESAMKAKDGEVSFLRGHVAQLSQNISQISEKLPQLPPSQEEAKKKGWWRFWK